MAVFAVAFDGTRVFAMDTNTNIGHWVGSGGTPASEAQNAYQNGLAVNKKVTASVLTGIDLDPAPSVVDMTSATRRLWFIKVYVADFGDVNATFGVSAGVGSSNADYYKYNLAGSGAKLSVYDKYPSQGGYILTAIDPNIAAWRDGSGVGTPDLTNVDWYGAQCSMIVGSAKSENFAIDSIDVGTGLTMTAGDGASDPGSFPGFVEKDQDTTTVRWGCVKGSGKAVQAWCLLTIGSATATEFTDIDSTVTFRDGYHSAGLVGTLVDIQNASSIMIIGCTIIGEGTRNGVAANDTRPDFVVSGTSGTFDFFGDLRNHRNITFTSVCDVYDASLECELLTQASANIERCIITTLSLTSIACLQDPTFGTAVDLNNVDFIQGGAGHALEITTAGSYDLTNITFTDYGADTTDSAAIDVTETTGTVTLNIIGGDTPTYKTAGATVIIVANPVTTKLIVQDTAGTKIENARALVTAGSGGSYPSDVTVTITRVSTTASVAHTAHGLANGDLVVIKDATQNEYNGIQTISNVSTNAYDYTVAGSPTTPATGTIKSTAAFISDLTDVNGEVSDTRTFTVDQPLSGRVRKSSGSPYYKTAQVVGTTDKDNGVVITVVMLSDE
jgi:hypothetical protein